MAGVGEGVAVLLMAYCLCNSIFGQHHIALAFFPWLKNLLSFSCNDLVFAVMLVGFFGCEFMNSWSTLRELLCGHT